MPRIRRPFWVTVSVCTEGIFMLMLYFSIESKIVHAHQYLLRHIENGGLLMLLLLRIQNICIIREIQA
jgi:hypothetical protein